MANVVLIEECQSRLEDSFAVNNVALVDGVRRTLNLVQPVRYYIDHQLEVIERRSQFRSAEAETRVHIPREILIAMDNINKAVTIIRASQHVDAARAGLTEAFELSETWANHIRDMPLRRLTTLETTKLRDELEELQITIDQLEHLLAHEALRRESIGEELIEARERYSVSRRSRIIPDSREMLLEDLMVDEELVISVSPSGYAKSVLAKANRTQARGGRGSKVQGSAKNRTPSPDSGDPPLTIEPSVCLNRFKRGLKREIWRTEPPSKMSARRQA